MKSLLKFVILSAWLLFVAALWKNCQLPAGSTTVWSLPSLGMLSISRKIADVRPTTGSLPYSGSAGWPGPELLPVIPVTGR
ncbi:MAG: hypothetical protein ABIQ93_08065 [Saprospiraceae bacterium]